MQSQVKILCCLALLIGLTAQKPYGAEVPAKILAWPGLSNDKVQVLNDSSAQGEVISSYIPFFIDIGSRFFTWDPKVSPKNTSEEVIREPVNSIDELMKNLFIQFDVSDVNHFRKVWFKPTADLKYRGLFGLHDFAKKRPFVILRMGIHGNVDELIAERFLAKIIYEDLDANFLILESLTSHAFLSNNKNISFGGIDEGLQTFFVLNEMKKTALADLVTSYHLLSVSLGGHGTFVTALLDQSHAHQLKSILNFCPLINLKETFDRHAQAGPNQAFVDVWNVRRLKAVFPLYENKEALTDWWKTLFDFQPRFTPTLLKILNTERIKPLISVEQMNSLVPGMKWPKGFAEHLENSKSFYELNDFWSYYRSVSTPMMIYTTPKDPLVLNDLNSEKVFRGQQPGEFTNLKYHRLERGLHCGLAPVYQWDYLVKLVKDGLEL